MSGPLIPERYSSPLSVARQNGLRAIETRKASTSSIVSAASSTDDFITSKIEDVSLDIDYSTEIRRGLKEAFDDGNLPASQYRDAVEVIDKDVKPKENELVVLKRQKKLVRNHMDENLPSHVRLEDAYANVIMNKVMAATAKLEKKKYR